MSFFKPQINFPLNFASPFSVMIHNRLKSFKWHLLWTKIIHQGIIFQTFESSNESSHNSSCHFWNQKVRVYSNFASLFSVQNFSLYIWNCKPVSILHHSSVSWEVTPLYFFSWNFVLFWWKEPIKVLNFRFLISPNLYLDRLLLLKEYSGVVSHDNKDWCKIWRKTD